MQCRRMDLIGALPPFGHWVAKVSSGPILLKNSAWQL